MTVWTPSEAQKKFIDSLIESKVPQNERANWYHHLRQVTANSRLTDAINTLKKLPYLPGHTSSLATEEGAYVNPNSLELYRVKARNGEHGQYLAVELYSQTVKVKRMLKSGEIVDRGTFNYVGTVRRVGLQADWKLTDSELAEYVTGICNFCFRALKDGRSVKHNYGPECAKKHGLPWGD